ncbi:MAG TPA: hypothetical protein PLD55_10940 [bacterium]|nr:hypothetical protein [bacterium]
MTLKKCLLKIVFISILAVSPFVFSESNDPFTGAVEVEDGENVVNWEEGIFGPQQKKKKEEEVDNDRKEEQKKEIVKKEEKPVKNDVTADDRQDAENVPENTVENSEPDENIEEYGKNSPEWGKYYGENIKVTEEGKFVEVQQKDPVQKEDAALAQNEEPFMFPIDLLLWSHGGDGYNAMINTGVKVSYWNVYSVLSVGTDFSTIAARPLSLGVSAGGFYRLSDFSITADLGYEKVWDFGDNAAINDYALGLRAGLSYSVLSWFAISAGAGVNYSIFKDSSFEEGKFIPMFFGGFEFSLIK